MTCSVRGHHLVGATGHCEAAASFDCVQRVLGDGVSAHPEKAGQARLHALDARCGLEPGSDWTWADDRHGHAVTAQLAVYGFAVALQERFAGGVGGVAGNRLEAGRRRDVDDRSAATVHHRRQEPRHQVERHFDIQLYEPELALAVSVNEFAVRGEPGSVDQDLDVAKLTDGPLEGIPCSRFDEVAGERLGAHAVLGRNGVGDRPSSGRRRATRQTAWPRAANARATAAPMPDEPPVTRAIAVGEGDGSATASSRRLRPWQRSPDAQRGRSRTAGRRRLPANSAGPATSGARFATST